MSSSPEGTVVAFLSGPATTIGYESSRPGRDGPAPAQRTIALWLGLFALALFVIRLSSAPGFSGNEWRLAAYALDAVQSGRWSSQTDTLGEAATKPPLLTWLVTLTVLPTVQVSQVVLYWPSAFATIATALVLLRVGLATLRMASRALRHCQLSPALRRLRPDANGPPRRTAVAVAGSDPRRHGRIARLANWTRLDLVLDGCCSRHAG